MAEDKKICLAPTSPAGSGYAAPLTLPPRLLDCVEYVPLERVQPYALNARLTVSGVQGHSAYAHLADNPVHRLVTMLARLTGEPLDEQQQQYLTEARARTDAEYERKSGNDDADDLAFPEYAAFCQHCHAKAVIQTDGCLTCLNCGDSKCG